MFNEVIWHKIFMVSSLSNYMFKGNDNILFTFVTDNKIQNMIDLHINLIYHIVVIINNTSPAINIK